MFSWPKFTVALTLLQALGTCPGHSISQTQRRDSHAHFTLSHCGLELPFPQSNKALSFRSEEHRKRVKLTKPRETSFSEKINEETES